MACTSVIVDTDNRIHLFLTKSTYQVVGTFLHLWIGSLNSIEFDTARITTCLYRRNGTSTKSDAIVITTNNHNLVAFLGLFLQAVAFRSITYATSQHNDFVVSILLLTFLMFESQDRTADKRLSELVSEIRGTIRSLDENLLRRLVKPFANWQKLLPLTVFFCARITGHIDCSTCDWPRTNASTHTVTNLTACSCRSSVERFHRCGEVVRLSLEADDTLNVADNEIVARAVILRGKLLHDRSFSKSDIIFISGNDMMRILLGRLLNHLEEGRLLLLAIDDKGSTEDFVSAMLAVNLGKTKDLAISKFTAKLTFHLMQILNLFRGKGKTFLLVVFLQIFDTKNRFRLLVNSKNVLIKPVIHTLQHRVIICIFTTYRKIFLYAADAGDSHILRYFHCIGAPRRNHFPTRTDEITLQVLFLFCACLTIQPAKLFYFCSREGTLALSCYDALLRSLEESYHLIYG